MGEGSVQDDLELALRRLANRLDGRLSGRLTNGLYLERSHLPKKWCLSAYTGECDDVNDVEFVIEPRRVVDIASDRPRFMAWLEEQAVALQAKPARNRTGQYEDSWRGGFTLPNALEFVRRWTRRYAPEVMVRWPDSPVRDLPAASLAGETLSNPGSDPLALTLDAMVRSARGAESQSDTVRTATAKNKEVRFPDDETFKSYLGELLEVQGGACAISGLPVEMRGGDRDPDMVASLDRKDPDGHYEPGNVQIVCWFINRWKSDDRDENFRRLLSAVRAVRLAPGAPPQPGRS